MDRLNTTGRSEAALPELRKRTAIGGMLLLAWIVAYVDRIVISTAIIPIAGEFGLDNEDKGYVLGAFYLSYAVMQLGGGALTDRFGARITLIVCLLTWSAFTGLTGLAWSLPVLIIARLLFGVGEGSFSPASASAIATYFPYGARARLQALMGSTGFIGSAFGSAAVAWTVATFGWRETFIGLAMIGMVVALGFFTTLPRIVRAKEYAGDLPQLSWGDVARAPGLWRIALLWFCACIAWVGVQSWMPSYLVETRHLSLIDVGLCAIFPGLAGFAGTNLAGRMLDQQGGIWPRRVFLLAAALIPACLLAIPLAGSMPVLAIIWSICAAAIGPINATVLAFPVKSMPHAATGRAMGLINFCGQIAGMLTSVIVGRLVSIAGGNFTPAFLFLAFVGGAGFVVGIFLRPQPLSLKATA